MSFIDVVLQSNKKHFDEVIGEEKFDDIGNKELTSGIEHVVWQKLIGSWIYLCHHCLETEQCKPNYFAIILVSI